MKWQCRFLQEQPDFCYILSFPARMLLSDMVAFTPFAHCIDYNATK